MCFDGITKGDMVRFSVDCSSSHDKRITVTKGIVINVSEHHLSVIASTPTSPHLGSVLKIEKERIRGMQRIPDTEVRCGHISYKRGDTLLARGPNMEKLRGELLGVVNDVAVVHCDNGACYGAGLGLWMKV